MVQEQCAQCGFDSELYNASDTINSQSIVPAVLRAASEELGDDVLARRPNADTWSIAEYVDHVREMAFGNRFVIESTLQDPGVDLGDPPPSDAALGPVRSIDLDRVIDGVEDEYAALRSLLGSLDESQWDSPVTVGGDQLTVGWFARHVVHDGLHHMADIGRIRHGFGLGATTHTGSVEQISVSNGGVPKRPVASAPIGPTGVGGDSQNDRRHHGRPVQAVCLWSADIVAQLASEGHPIAAGNAGENLTISDIDWSTLRPGVRIDVGAVPLLISAHAVPCAKNAQWFADRDFSRILHGQHPGMSRLYAIPLGSGTVYTGDPVVVEPA